MEIWNKFWLNAKCRVRWSCKILLVSVCYYSFPNLCVLFVSYQSRCRLCGGFARDSCVLVVHEIAVIFMMMSFNLSARLFNLLAFVGVCNLLHLNT